MYIKFYMFPAGRIETQGQPGAAAFIARKVTVDRAQAVPNALVRRGLSGWTPGAFLREYTLQHVCSHDRNIYIST